MRKPSSPHSKIIVQLDEAAHIELAKRAAANDRTIRDEARYLLKKALGLLPSDNGAARMAAAAREE